MNRWLRVVLPGWPTALGGVAMLQLLFCAPYLWVVWQLAVPVGGQAAKSAFVPVMFATVGYGLFRWV